MSTNAFTTKIPLRFKYSLFTFFVISAFAVLSTAGYAQKIVEQQPVSDPVKTILMPLIMSRQSTALTLQSSPTSIWAWVSLSTRDSPMPMPVRPFSAACKLNALTMASTA